MLFPLLLSLSQRVAGLLSAAMLGLVALVGTLLFAKKAFLLSAAALAIAAWDANRKKGEHVKEIHVHRVPVYKEYHPEHYESHEEYKSDYLTPETDYGASASHNYDVSQSYSSSNQHVGRGPYYGGVGSNYSGSSSNYAGSSSNYAGSSSNYGGSSSNYGGSSSNYRDSSSKYGRPSSNYGGTGSNVGTTSSNYGGGSQKYNLADKSSLTQQFSPSHGSTEKSQQFYGTAAHGLNQVPYRSPYRYRYRKGRESKVMR